ncbi:MAG: hypothetical protein R2725_11550 [Solirubrobacterales bacterium]
MRRRPRRAAAAVVAVALALAAGPVALAPAASAWAGGSSGAPSLRQLAAKADHQAEPTSRPFLSPTIALGKHDGYTVEVSGSPNRVYLAVYRGKGISLYIAPGLVTAGHLEASFGSFGRVSMRFRASRNRTWIKPRRKCRGKHLFVNRRGTYAGTVAFRGEGGYVSVRSHRAKGTVTAIAAKCLRKVREFERERLSGPASSSRSGPVPAFLTVRRQEVDSVTYLGAEARRRGASFFAESTESRDKVAIIRYVYADGGPGRLRIADALTSAKVSAPAPFHGSATYRAAADGTKTWEGSLSADFPGAPRTPLTGEGFNVHFSASF